MATKINDENKIEWENGSTPLSAANLNKANTITANTINDVIDDVSTLTNSVETKNSIKKYSNGSVVSSVVCGDDDVTVSGKDLNVTENLNITKDVNVAGGQKIVVDNIEAHSLNNAINATVTNVKNSINGHAISDIFEDNGTTVKSSTNSTNATNANYAILALNVTNPPLRKVPLLDNPVLLSAQSGMQDINFNQNINGGDTIEIWYISNSNITTIAQGERYSLVSVQIKTCASSSGGGIGAIGSGFFKDIGEIWGTEKSSQYSIYPTKISLTAMQKSGPSYEVLYIGQIYKLNY